MKKVYKQVKLNFEESDYELIKKQADDNNLAISVYIKNQLKIKDKLTRKLPDKNKPTNQVDSKLLYEINKIGINLNQISRVVNMYKYIDDNIRVEITAIRVLLELLLNESYQK